MADGTMLEEMGTDAQKWTERFLNASGLDNAGPDFRHTVLTWFANAIEAGRSAGIGTAMEDSLNEIAARSNENAHAHGWYDIPRSFGEVVALFHSEASEALEEWRDNHAPDERYYSVPKYRPEPSDIISDLGPEATEDLQAWATKFDRLGDEAKVIPFRFDCPEHIASELVVAGFLKPEGVPSELADIIIRVGDAAEEYNIDIGREVLLKMAYNATRPYKHGGKRA
jgi:hypothetical protein